MILASIPSPSRGVIHLGPIPIRAYALFIILGIVVAASVGDRRLQARGGRKGAMAEVATWAVPFGLVGARLYHVATNPELYWGHADSQGTLAAFEIWHGGLGIWGGVLGGALGAYIGCRRYHLDFATVADALAPGLVLAQAIGRWGNYFNQELFGRPTSLPWGLEIDAAHRADLPARYQGFQTFHPTFLYESLWDVGVALLVIWADRKFRLNRGRAFALYVAAYTAGRFWIESLRIDDAHKFFGLRLNDWTSLIIFVAACAYLYLKRGPGRPVDEVAGDESSVDGPRDDEAAADGGRTLTT